MAAREDYGSGEVGFDWAWDLVFARDLVYFKPDATERVSTAYFHASDVIFRQGDPGLNFFVIEEGEVEILRQAGLPAGQAGSNEDKVLAVLGPGDFFGEMALLENRPHNASVRARTHVRLLVLGNELFHHMTAALTPLKQLLHEAARKRAASLWQRVPGAQPLLEGKPVAQFAEPPTCPPFRETATFAEVLRVFNDDHIEIGFIVDDQNVLKGLVTRTDLFQAVSEGARPETPVQNFMTSAPIALGKDEPVELAVSIMRNRSLKWVPVVESRDVPRFIGYVRAQKLLEVVLRGMNP